MHRVLIAIAIFALSFLVASQVLRLSRGEGDLMAWILIAAGVAGFIAVVRARGRVVPPRR